MSLDRLVRLVEHFDAGGPTRCWPGYASACDPAHPGAGHRLPAPAWAGSQADAYPGQQRVGPPASKCSTNRTNRSSDILHLLATSLKTRHSQDPALQFTILQITVSPSSVDSSCKLGNGSVLSSLTGC